MKHWSAKDMPMGYSCSIASQVKRIETVFWIPTQPNPAQTRYASCMWIEYQITSKMRASCSTFAENRIMLFIRPANSPLDPHLRRVLPQLPLTRPAGWPPRHSAIRTSHLHRTSQPPQTHAVTPSTTRVVPFAFAS